MFNLDDLKYLFIKTSDDSRETYRRDTTKNKKIVKNIQLYNKNFSETFFMSWVSNMFLRYIFYCTSKNETNKLANFERIHLLKGISSNWNNILDFYNEFENVEVKFIDFIDYVHATNVDCITLKACVVCSLKKDKQNINDINEQLIKYFDIEFVKNNEGEKYIEKQSDFTSNCPNCGAPTEIVTMGVCSHCQELISIYDNVWKIRNINEK